MNDGAARADDNAFFKFVFKMDDIKLFVTSFKTLSFNLLSLRTQFGHRFIFHESRRVVLFRSISSRMLRDISV